MNEQLLQFIWLHQYFNKNQLCTTDGEPLQIIKPGTLNSNQGPDFLNARIRVGKTLWAGNIELHILASDWHKHRHALNENYQNIVLHVVWKNDGPKKALVGFPELELQSLVPKLMLNRYQKLMQSETFIPCGNAISTVNELVFAAWKEKLLVERLEEKVNTVFAMLLETGDNWEEVFWRLLCRNFGVKVNAGPFESAARQLPYKVLMRNRNSLVKLEALLMGQTGLLNDSFTDEYPLQLKKEFLALKAKYNLPRSLEGVLFLRMRPQAFPTIRLSQLAAFLHRNSRPFMQVVEAASYNELHEMFRLPASGYWENHYRFDAVSGRANKTMGDEMINNIIANTITPFVFAWGIYQSNEQVKQKALNWLISIKPEENIITKGFRKLGVTARSAYDSQALIQMRNQYCREKRCLECAVGSALVRKN
ncbi:MAG: DUF2851 family protein [Dinghuibacter sp.]|nr:DUF2851 family protein [Dinghuibacter sp.]